VVFCNLFELQSDIIFFLISLLISVTILVHFNGHLIYKITIFLKTLVHKDFCFHFDNVSRSLDFTLISFIARFKFFFVIFRFKSQNISNLREANTIIHKIVNPRLKNFNMKASGYTTPWHSKLQKTRLISKGPSDET
jgi:hypothetical protein